MTCRKVNSLSWQAEVFYRRLMSKADDWGRYTGDPQLLKCELFARKPSVRETDIPHWIAECEKAGLLSLWEENGEMYLVIRDWQQDKRAKVSKWPEPPKQAEFGLIMGLSPPKAGMPGTCPADAPHMPGTCPDAQHMLSTCSAHALGGEDGFDLEGECGSRARAREAARGAPLPSQPNSPAQRPQGEAEASPQAQEARGSPPAAATAFAEWPSLQEVHAYANTIGLAGWVAEVWFLEMEGAGWRHNGREVRDWRSLVRRKKIYWEADGRPMKPNGRYGKRSDVSKQGTRNDGQIGGDTAEQYANVG